MDVKSPIVAIKKTDWKDGKSKYTLTNEDGERGVCYSPQAESLVKGQPLPDGWTIEYNKDHPDWDPMIKAPMGAGGKGGGGGFRDASWKNTEAGFRYEQERMDRRTSLMQAVANGAIPNWTPDDMYSWLRLTAGNVQTPAPQAQNASPGTTEPNRAAPAGSDIWAGGGLCPGCRAPSGMRHGTGCPNNDPFASED